MRLELTTASRVYIDLRATGLLRAVGHDPTLVARAEAATIDLDDGRVSVRFPVRDFEAPGDMSAADRAKMLESVRGPEVLDEARFPAVTLEGRFAGTIDGGRLEGALHVRGAPRSLAMDVRAVREGDEHVVRGTWEGTLTALGVKPFKALLGALRLSDWIRLRVEARLRA
jgi:polyisoprenoid-binding protein YceI